MEADFLPIGWKLRWNEVWSYELFELYEIVIELYEIVSVRFSVTASSFGIGFKTELFVDYIKSS